MRLPIPNDWDSASWECYQIVWPQSVKWTAVLLGLLSQPMRGRTWDERTGIIRDVQAVGWDIWARNALLPSCVVCPDDDDDGSDCSPPYSPDAPMVGYGSGLDSEECDMGQVVTDVTVVNGHLVVWFGPCCSRDLGLLSDIGLPSEGADIDVPWEPSNPGGVVYSACSKSWGIVEAVYEIIEASFSAANELPWKMVGYVEDAVGYDLDNNWLLMLLANVTIGVWVGKGYLSDVYDQVEQERIAARVVELFSDDSSGVPTDTLFEQIKGAFKAEIWPSTKWQLFDQAINALGRHDMDTVAKLASTTRNVNCDYPALPSELFADFAVGRPWRYVWDFRDGSQGWEVQDGQVTAGVGWWGNSSATDNRVPIGGRFMWDQLNNGSVLTDCAVIVHLVGDENLDDNYVAFGSEEYQMIGLTAVTALTGDNPCAPGYFIVTGAGNDPLGSSETEFTLRFTAYHPPAPPYHDDVPELSQKVIAVLFAGTGPGPLSVPPVYP